MLEHFERLQLAHYLCQRIAERHQDEILIGAVYGSTARAADTPWSDLEMWFVMQDGCQRGDLHLLYRDAAVSCFFHERSALEESVSQPSTRWPFYMGVLSELQVLYGDPALVQGWIEMGTYIPPQQFIPPWKPPCQIWWSSRMVASTPAWSVKTRARCFHTCSKCSSRC